MHFCIGAVYHIVSPDVSTSTGNYFLISPSSIRRSEFAM
jgi:hypothetical protein